MRVALYYNHAETLGHTNRATALALKLQQHGHEVVVINGGQRQPFLDNFKIDIRDLPFPITGRKNFYRVGSYAISEDGVNARIQELFKIISDFNPDVFITEFFPLGRPKDSSLLLPTIRQIKTSLKHIKIVGSVGYPMISNNYEKILRYAELYDKILVHTPYGLDEYFIKKLYGLLRNMDYLLDNHNKVFSLLKNKITFTGYIINTFKQLESKEEIKEKLQIGNKKFILVSRGGGVIYPALISNTILSKKYLEDVFILAVAGPSTSNYEWEIFKKLEQRYKDIKVERFVPNLIDYINACDVSVSMAGYNTSIECLWLKKKAIFFPIETKGKFKDFEQAYRCQLLKKCLNATTLNYRDSSPQEIANSIKIQLNNKQGGEIKIEDIWFNGLDNSYKELMKLVEVDKSVY